MTAPVTYDQHDEETGKFTPTYSPEDFLNALEKLELPTTSEVAGSVDCAHRTALHHLNQLEEDGRVRSRKAGNAKLWMLADDV
jgi:predicted ArsR family transcriptional regulator